jgi:hypothetical protein
MSIEILTCHQKRFDGSEDNLAYLVVGGFETHVTSFHKAKRFKQVFAAMCQRLKNGVKLEHYEMSSGMAFYCNSTICVWKPWRGNNTFYGFGDNSFGTIEQAVCDYINWRFK